MKRRAIFFVLTCMLSLALFFLQVLLAFPADDQLRPEIYQQRRTQLMAEWDSSSIAVLYSGDVKMRLADVAHRFRAENNFYYLTGCEAPSSALLLIPAGTLVRGETVREILFLRPQSGSYYGNATAHEEAPGFAGFSAVLPYDEFTDYLNTLLPESKTLYVSDWPTPAFIYDVLSGNKYFLENEGKKALKKKYPGLQIKSLTRQMMAMRCIKSPQELALMQRAIDITCDAFAEAARSAEPGMYEYELQAAIEYVYMRMGAEDKGFPCIIGSGANSLILHYDANRRQMQDGDMVVMDIGAEYHGYSADLSRTIPVNGRFSPAQKDIYRIVLNANRKVIEAVKPGVTIRDLDRLAQKLIAEGLLALGLIKEESQGRRFLPHGVSHALGLQVHDVGGGEPLTPGFVLTVEPGIYISPEFEGVDEKYWNIGIRIEDDVVVTETGCMVLTARAPKTIAGIEKLMKAKGIGNHPL
ncbi:aminopeptidase P family protein, partial [candidate division KSB1 bacterium]|nr:aminopeptidase P family protein [candidate division KSB1 bacterium]